MRTGCATATGGTHDRLRSQWHRGDNPPAFDMKPANGLRSSDWIVQSIPDHATAVAMIRRFHYAQGAPNTSTHRHGLYPSGVLVGDLMGVALWIPPTKLAAKSVNQDWQGVLSLSRLVVHPEVGTNGASFLLGRSMRLVDKRWHSFVTYADTAHGHTGAIYKATNWTCLGPVPAGDVWVTPDGRQVGRKRGGRTYTKDEMVAQGCVRQPSAPKVKFVYYRKGAVA